MSDAEKGSVTGRVTKKINSACYDVLVASREYPYEGLLYPGERDAFAFGDTVVISFLENNAEKPFISGKPHERSRRTNP